LFCFVLFLLSGEIASRIEQGLRAHSCLIFFQKLTDAFCQVDARLEREFEGSRLGLTLVQKHMSLHGGTLAFESEVGVGTKATLSFPPERTINDDRSSSIA
jgi:signal transduction histidine kinase